jgi:glycosyltransferase involved in cell wall biosynthesis
MWIVSQLGAREHYAVARALARTGKLAGLCTDYWAGPLGRMSGTLLGGRFRSLASRYHADLAACRVTSWNAGVLSRQFRGRCGGMGPYERFLEEGRWFGGKVCAWLEPHRPAAETLFSYDTTALEPFEWARANGVRCILGQMDPGRVEAEIVAAERERWPGWEAIGMTVPEEYHGRRAEERELADRIIVNSKWSRDALIRQSVPADKLVIVPLVYEAEEKAGIPKDPTPKAPLRVLFLGQVNLRKGIPYLMEAARLLEAERVEIEIVGQIQISEQALSGAPRNVRFHGPVSRDEAASHYRRADVFVLPTLSDGFAITQLEAMAHGLPVIATPRCGEVVTDGVDGWIVPAGDSGALAEAILTLANDRSRLAEMGSAALRKSRRFTIQRLAACLDEI